MGFCFGGPFALLAAARYGTNAGISFHGSHVKNHLDEVDGVRSRSRSTTGIGTRLLR